MTTKQAKLPKKPKYEPKQTVPKGDFPVVFKKASEIKDDNKSIR
jgi:hypothetical protein